MPPLKKKSLLVSRLLNTIKKEIVDTFINWWNIMDIHYSLKECTAKFETLLAEYRHANRFRTELWDCIISREYNILKHWYSRQIADHPESFIYLGHLVEHDTSIPEVRLQLQDLIETWRIDAASRPPLPPLAKLAMDKESIHTSAAMNQQVRTRDILFAIPVPSTQRTMNEIINAWTVSLGYSKKIERVKNDMLNWARKSLIVVEGDYLYRRFLRHLWTKIVADKENYEILLMRLWEECSEAVGTCAMGHINRLCNVMAGIVDGIMSPLDPKESFQDEMSRISRLELSVEEKQRQAVAIMDQYAIMAEERDSWLSAF